MPTILRVGLTGGIGAGKSTVAGLLDGPRFLIIDADHLGHAVLESDENARTEIVAALGAGVLDSAGRVDRSVLGQVVFGDSAARQALEAIVHPRIRAAEEAKVAEWGVREGIVVTEAALLIETGGHERYDRIAVVTAPMADRLERLSRRGIERADAKRRINAQLPDKDKVAVADHVVHNDGTAIATTEQVERIRIALLDDLSYVVRGLSLPARQP